MQLGLGVVMLHDLGSQLRLLLPLRGFQHGDVLDETLEFLAHLLRLVPLLAAEEGEQAP